MLPQAPGRCVPRRGDGIPIKPAAQRHRLALLALLASACPGAISREKLIAYLWPERETEPARNLLRQAVHALRRALGEDAILSAGDDLPFNPRVVACDLIAFEDALRAGELEQAVGAYSGPFLDGFFLSDAPEFERWAEAMRDRLARSYAQALERLAQQHEEVGDLVGCVEVWTSLAKLDPYDSRIAVQLMRSLAAAGNRAGALRHAGVHSALLRAEFGVEPDPEVESLAERLRAEPVAAHEAHAAATDLPPSRLLAEDGTPGARVVPHPFRRKAKVRLAAVSAMGLAVVGFGVWALRDNDGPSMTNPAYTILADVHGNADADVRRAVGGLLRAALEQASVLMPVGDDDVRNGLARMQRPDTLPLDVDAARELAYRGSVRTVVVPSLDRIGGAFALTVRVLDAETGAVIAAERATSDHEDGLIPAADDAVRRLHRQLGARRSELDATRRLVEATTPSFEAYRAYVRALDFQGAVTPQEGAVAVELLREALAIDPGFASAWLEMARIWGNTGQRDSQLVAIGNLERHLHRGAEHERLWYAAAIATARGDHPRALTMYDRLTRYHPSPMAWNNRGITLGALGRHEEALVSFRRAVAEATFGPSDVMLQNVARTLAGLGRAAEARAFLDSVDMPHVVFRTGIMMALEEWPQAESLAAAVLARWGPGTRSWVELALAGIAARRGEIASAVDRTDRAARVFGPRGVQGATVHAAAELLLTLVAGQQWPRPPVFGNEGVVNGQAWSGIWNAVQGDTAEARVIALAVRDSFPTRYRGAAPEFMEAVIAARGERWGEVIELLGPVAAHGETGRRQSDAWVTPLPIRWLLATAHERAGQLEAAAAAYEHVLATDLWPDYLLLRGIPYSFAHQRLVVLYARIGRLDDAARHWEAFRGAFTNPDPEFRHLIDEARQALEPANGGRIEPAPSRTPSASRPATAPFLRRRPAAFSKLPRASGPRRRAVSHRVGPATPGT